MSDTIKSRTELRKSKEANRKQKKKPVKGKSIIKRIFFILLFVGLAGLIGGGGLFAFYASTAPKLDEELLKVPLSSEFLDINGDVFYKSGTEKREFVPYDQIPDTVREAILATEDVRFFKHNGMDFYRLGGAVLANFKSGFGSQGASTITQQVIKNSFLQDDKTLKRKAQEAWLAFQLENKYEKEEIFEMYFNKILMSGSTYGIGTASKHFFGKELKELELNEIAMLAGMPQSPNGYNPFRNPERAETRRNIVLGLMVQHKKITKEEMEAAKAIPVTASLIPEAERQANDNTKYPAYLDIVRDELEAAGLLDILSDGVKIQTSLDPDAQIAVENAIRSDVYKNDKMQAGMTVLNTKTGEIIAVGGGRNFSTGFWNFAIDEKRQTGSSIKPILDYGPAIEYLNWSTGQTVVDEPYNYIGLDDKPVNNIDNKFQGPMTIREALYKSRNIPAVKTFEEVGRAKAFGFAEKLGLKYTNDYPSNALGGADEFSTVQMAGAYAAFGNNGVYTKPHTIKQITYRDGKTVKNMAPDAEVAMKDSTAYMITDILRDVLRQGGTGTRAAIPGLDVAGKTGTSSDAKDSWFAGYTSNYTIATWAGYQDRTPMETYEGERFVPQDLFKQVMSSISNGKETAKFQQPPSVESATIVYRSNPLMLASNSTPQNMKRTELFVKGSLPELVAKELELDAPNNLTADYNEEEQSVSLNWSHTGADFNIIDGDIQFIVYASVNGGERQEMTRTTDFSTLFNGVELGVTYTFSVVATVDGLESSPTSVELRIEEPEEVEEEIIEEEIPEEEIEDEEDLEEVDPEENNNNNNNNNNGSNENNENNGNNNNNDNNDPNDGSVNDSTEDGQP
ncbi:PBP1A family penicillin-binding protein [Sporosarcina siberiensis]|uniref:PBP1A family penicillin-binding protein n=1 Tax=Sporosarcina siberiensis TaxID=1365606 RepID=A0ABW4SF95_9BACL